MIQSTMPVAVFNYLFAQYYNREPADVARQARRAKLLDELVDLDRSGKSSKRREAVLAELEKLWE